MIHKHQMPIDMLRNAGYEAYFVGGCTRDCLMGRPLSDVDITTNAMPEEIKQVFSHYRTLDIGIKHGTVTVILDGESYEITTYRYDGGYTDHRHPTVVRFGVELTEDLARRDFTMNAIAFDGRGSMVDPFGGREDIEKKVVRCVGDPILRFEEDSLRILRGLRFASVLGFAIDEQTAAAMREKKHLLVCVSAERVWQEFSKLILGKDAAEIIRQYSDVLEVILPELSQMRGFDQRNHHHIYDVLTHTIKALEATSSDLVLRLAVLLHDCGKPSTFSLDENGEGHFYGHARRSVELASERLLALRVDNQTKERVLRLIEHHDSPPETNEKQVVRRMRKMGQDYPLLVALRRADNRGQAEKYYREEMHEKCMDMYQTVLSQSEEDSGRRLNLNGKDLLSSGAVEGKNIGILLTSLLEDVLEGRVANEKEALLRFAKDNYPTGFGEKYENKTN